jgi:hypothetical protein
LLEDDDRIVLVQSLGFNGNMADAIEIPKATTRSVRVVEDAEAVKDG